MCDAIRPRCTRARSYDESSATALGNYGVVRQDRSVTSRTIYNTSGVDIYVGFGVPSTSTGRWPGAWPVLNGNPTPVFETGQEVFFRPQSGADAIVVTVLEEYET